MKLFFETLLKHPISVACYGLYSWLCYQIYSGKIEHDHWLKANRNNPHALGYGEGIGYSMIFLVVVGAMFGLVLLVNALVRKQVVFYMWLGVVVFIQTIVTLNL